LGLHPEIIEVVIADTAENRKRAAFEGAWDRSNEIKGVRAIMRSVSLEYGAALIQGLKMKEF